MNSISSTLLLALCTGLTNAEILDSATAKSAEPWYPREFIFAPVEVISTPTYDRDSEQEEHVLSLKRTDMFIGRRRRRAVRDPSPNALDDQAAAAIFGDEGKWDHKPKHRESRPPAPPDPVLYNRQFAVTPSDIQRERQHGSGSEYDGSSSSHAHPKAPSGTSIGTEQGPSSSKMEQKIQQRSDPEPSQDPSSSSTTTDPKIPLGIEQGRSDAELQDKIDQRSKSQHPSEESKAPTSAQQETKEASSNSSDFEIEREMPLSKIQSQAEHEMDHSIPVGIEQEPSSSEMKKKIEQRPLPASTDDHVSSSQQTEDHKATSDPKIPLGIEQGLSHSEMLRKIDQRPSHGFSEESSFAKQPEPEEASKSGDHETQQGSSSSNLEDKLQQRPLSPNPSGDLSSISNQPKIQSEPSGPTPLLDREQSSPTLQHKLQQKPSPITPFEDLSSAQSHQQVQISFGTRSGNERRPPLLKNKQNPQPIFHRSDMDEEQRSYGPSMLLRTPLMSIDVQGIQRGPSFFSPRTRYLPLATNVVPFDSHVDPDFPLEAPRARGLVDEGSPFVDNDFRTGYRFRALPSSAQHRTYEIGARGRQRAGYIYDTPLFSGAEPLPYGGRSTNNHYVISSPGRYYEVAPPAYIIG